MDIIEATRAVLCALDERGCDVREVARDLHRLADAVERASLPTRKEYATLHCRHAQWMISGAGPAAVLTVACVPFAEAINAAIALGWSVHTVRVGEDSDEALLVREAKP